jgi:ATP-dependent Clp protease adaptor protein ClpS
MDQEATSTTTVLEPKTTKRKYPEVRIIVLDDNFNTFEHVANCLVKIIPGMSEERSWVLAVEVDREGLAEVWRGPLEQAELYHQQLISKGITMAPIEKT